MQIVHTHTTYPPFLAALVKSPSAQSRHIQWPQLGCTALMSRLLQEGQVYLSNFALPSPSINMSTRTRTRRTSDIFGSLSAELTGVTAIAIWCHSKQMGVLYVPMLSARGCSPWYYRLLYTHICTVHKRATCSGVDSKKFPRKSPCALR